MRKRAGLFCNTVVARFGTQPYAKKFGFLQLFCYPTNWFAALYVFCVLADCDTYSVSDGSKSSSTLAPFGSVLNNCQVPAPAWRRKS